MYSMLAGEGPEQPGQAIGRIHCRQSGQLRGVDVAGVESVRVMGNSEGVLVPESGKARKAKCRQRPSLSHCDSTSGGSGKHGWILILKVGGAEAFVIGERKGKELPSPNRADE